MIFANDLSAPELLALPVWQLARGRRGADQGWGRMLHATEYERAAMEIFDVPSKLLPLCAEAK
jgi:hypothetical protein